MINFRLGIRNLWATDEFDNLYCFTKSLTKNKHFEFEVWHESNELLVVALSTDFGGSDHAGPHITLGLLGYSLNWKIYDSRHWDYDNNTWETYLDIN
jgi:hypothetical protein